MSKKVLLQYGESIYLHDGSLGEAKQCSFSDKDN